jgi:signal transduction histidine kinase
MMWALGGVAVIVLDSLLLWGGASFGMSLGFSLAIAGWVYFPLRQWLWQRLSPAAKQTVERHLPQFIDTLFAARTGEELAANWRALLQNIYAPLTVKVLDRPADTPAIAKEGLALTVPDIAPGRSIELLHGHKGKRLFDRADERLATAMLALSRQAAALKWEQDRRAAEKEARTREKDLMLQDLHDGLGGLATNIGMLADLARNESGPPATNEKLTVISDLSREALREIRGFMQNLGGEEGDWHAVTADLRLAGRNLIEPHGVAFEFSAAVDAAAPPPDSLLQLTLFRVNQEALTNVVKHARAKGVRVSVEAHRDRLQLVIQDDGVGMGNMEAGCPAGPGKCRGLKNMQSRAQRLGGTLELAGGSGTTLRLVVPLPVKYPARGMAPGNDGR